REQLKTGFDVRTRTSKPVSHTHTQTNPIRPGTRTKITDQNTPPPRPTVIVFAQLRTPESL
ncbi:hypothetical protein, partial [Corynebacterium pyruviciproducens]|uniref:hypothetical protein n=1 Tax=Corynebacterium pyruviciproducens TaxID=598660 RepID=UPI00288B5F71